jgi:hypothetical protein
MVVAPLKQERSDEAASCIASRIEARRNVDKIVHWPAPGSEDTELGVLMEPEVGHGETEIYAGVQA